MRATAGRGPATTPEVTEMRYELLGPFRVTGDGGRRLAAAPKMETVLATLLVRANHVVSVDELVAEIWGGSAPRHAMTALYVYVSQLRKLLATAEPGGASLIETRAPGYLLRTEFGQVDLQSFQRLMGEGRAALREDDHERARASGEAALALWRGPALAQLRDGLVINDYANWLEELRLECTELLVEATLRLGRHRELVTVLRALIREHPLHETFYRQLMLALYHCERRAEALEVYRSARAVLNTELGLEPGHRLREVQRLVLSSDGRDLVRPAV
jgi:DNA-binding SARP family transcriptional activator